MATNVYGDGSNSTAGANTVVHYYDRAGVKAANRTSIYGQFADKKSMPPKMGKTFKISKFQHMYDRSTADVDFAAKGFMTARTAADVSTALTNATLAEGAGDVNKRTLSKITVETSIARYGEMIDYTDEVDIFSEDYIQVKYREELGELANSRYEDLIQLDMLGTSTTLFSGTATSKAGVANGIADDGSEDADWRISYDLGRKAVRKLVRNRAKKNTMVVTGSTKIGTTPIAKAYYAIIDADVKSDLENLTRGTTYETEYVYVPAHKYAGASALAEGEVGSMHEIRFIESEGAVVYAGKGAAVQDGYVGSLASTTVTGGIKTVTGAAANNVIVVDGVSYTVASGETINIAADATIDVTGGGDLVVSAATDGDRFDVHPIIFPTEGAFATVGLKGHDKIKFNSKSPSQVENGNPYGTTGFFSYNFFYAGIVLQPEKLLAMYVGASK